ncbi:hypothetical protein PIROE2DRAFT_2040 [Piromyces sp. E2]|nr:hypothetical protein PIROE2DRAFT_2040 [Piromyces sp. E2]|eukprot:OUM69859.1 hypothetical protein PIROE2DRAFT_2040 [Piromyces sp. E2]
MKCFLFKVNLFKNKGSFQCETKLFLKKNNQALGVLMLDFLINNDLYGIYIIVDTINTFIGTYYKTYIGAFLKYVDDAFLEQLGFISSDFINPNKRRRVKYYSMIIHNFLSFICK